MKTQSGNFTAQDGTSIYWKGWAPDKAPKAVVHVIHGYAEHIDRYGNVVGELLPAGYAVFGTDHRGHGKSEGKRGHVKSFQEFIDDEKQFWHNIIQTKFPGIPYFVLGHSMGSLIAMNYVEQNAVGMKGLILSGTGSLPGKDIPVLIQLGSRDTAFSGQRELFEMIGSTDKTFKLYEGLKHEVYNELAADRAKVLADLKNWLDGHI